jgi:DNA-binding CsgD family transcriptional regulator
MRVKDCAARQIEELSVEQVPGRSYQKSKVVEFRSRVVCSGAAVDRFLDGMTEPTRRRLLDRINDQLEHDVTPILVARNSKQQLIAFKVRKSDAGHHRSIVAFADLNDVPVPCAQVLQRVFDLTQAEVRLAQGVARGDSLEEVAAGLGIKISTARTQLASIFAKTQTRRQAKLVALLGRLAQLGA